MDLNKLLTTKVKIYIGCGVAAFFAFIIMVAVIASMILSPIQAVQNVLAAAGDASAQFFEKLGNWFTFNGFQTDEESFYDTISDTYFDYLTGDKKVTVDTTLVASILFYGQSINEEGHIMCDPVADVNCDDDGTKKANYDDYKSKAKDIMKNMIKSKIYYKCTIIEEYTEEEDGSKTPVYGDDVVCGTEESHCTKEKCTEDYELSTMTMWMAKTQDELTEWLKGSGKYILDWKLNDIDKNYATYDDVTKSELIDKTITEMFDQKDMYYDLMGVSSVGSGSFVSMVGSIPSEIVFPTEPTWCAQWTWARTKQVLANDPVAWNLFNTRVRGNAIDYYTNNLKLGDKGFAMDMTPAIGSIAIWSGGSVDCGGYLCGHVAFVENIEPNGKLFLSECGMTINGVKKQCKTTLLSPSEMQQRGSLKLEAYLHLIVY